MKTNMIFKSFVALVLGSAVMLTSCIEETFPEGSTATIEQVGQSPFAADGILTAMPTIMMNNYLDIGTHTDFGYPGIMGHLDRLAGEVFPVSGNVEGGNQYYDRFQFVMYVGVSEMMNAHSNWTMFFYNNYYQFIFAANAAVSAFSSTGEPSPEWGIASIYRAANYMDMARLFEALPAVASGEVGTIDYQIKPEIVGLTVPLVTEASTMEELQSNPRLPREQMWAFILNDLNNAETMLEGYVSDRPVVMPSQAVAYGLKARAYLWLGGYDEAIGDVELAEGVTVNVPTGVEAYKKAAEYARKAINASGCRILTEAEWLDPNTGFCKIAPSWMWALSQSTDTVLGNLHSWTAHASNDAVWGYGPLAQPGMNAILYARMSDTDFRKKNIVTPDQSWEAIKNYTKLTKDEFEGNTSGNRSFPIAPYAWFKFHTNTGEKYDNTVGNVTDIPLMRVEEMYLIEAEATAHYDAGTAKTLIADFMAHRDASYKFYGSDVVDEIIFQKRMELWGEGQIFFDLKRLNYGMITGSEGSNAPIDARYETNGRAPWWNVPIPLNAVQKNTGLKDMNNPDPCKTYLPINN